MAQNLWGATWAWTACFVLTVAISLVTRPRRKEDLVGLVHGLSDHPTDRRRPWYARPEVLAAIVLAMTLLLNILFW